jgi:uncharacterized protein (TIGR02118 family)
MIHKFVFLKRKADLSNQAFNDYWAGPHASELAARADVWTGVDAYKQNRVLPAIEGITPEPLWDGLVQVELQGRPSSAELRDDPRNRQVGRDDERFIDLDQVVQFFAEAKVVLDGPERGVKIISLPRRRPGLSPAEFSHHYRETHGELVRHNEAFVKYANRYVQHHAFADTVKATGGFSPYDGISEFWFDSLHHARAAWGDPSYMAELRADEKNFVGSPPSHRLIVEEVAIGRRA